VGAGLDLLIGREIPCTLREDAGAVAVDLAGERTLAPLGPLAVRGLSIALSPRGDEAVVTLRAEPGVAATLGDAPVETTVELARGDVVRLAGDAPCEIRVIG
jgi:hypothetical protein